MATGPSFKSSRLRGAVRLDLSARLRLTVGATFKIRQEVLLYQHHDAGNRQGDEEKRQDQPPRAHVEEVHQRRREEETGPAGEKHGDDVAGEFHPGDRSGENDDEERERRHREDENRPHAVGSEHLLRLSLLFLLQDSVVELVVFFRHEEEDEYGTDQIGGGRDQSESPPRLSGGEQGDKEDFHAGDGRDRLDDRIHEQAPLAVFRPKLPEGLEHLDENVDDVLRLVHKQWIHVHVFTPRHLECVDSLMYYTISG